MGELLHNFYFLASEDEVVNRTWRVLIDRYGFQETQVHRFGDGPVLSRLAKDEAGSAAVSITGHIAVVELRLKDGKIDDQLDSLQEVRRQLDELLLELIGESTIILGGGDYRPENRVQHGVQLANGGELLIFPEKDSEQPRLYLLAGAPTPGVRSFLRRELVPLDCRTYELRREIGFYQEQHQSILQKMDETNREIGEVLTRKGTDLQALEQEVDSLSEIHAVLTGYGFLLGKALHLLGRDLASLEKRLRRLTSHRDSFFFGQERSRIKRLLSALASSREDLARAVENARAAIDVVKSRVDLVRSRTNLDLQLQISSLMKQNVHIQEEALTMGIAASMVEFFVVLYYGLGVWKMLAGEELVHHIPLAVKGGLAIVFSLAVVAGTHKAAEAVKNKTYRGVALWGSVILAMVGIIVGVSALYR